MTVKELIKNIKGVFILPIKKRYFGKIKFYTPYFEPRGFCRSVIKIRKLIPLSNKELAENKKKGGNWAKQKYSNMPMTKRTKSWILKIFKYHFYIQIGTPIKIVNVNLGWKDKWGTPRFEWAPSFQIWIFNWQYVVSWPVPDLENTPKYADAYWEQVLWYLHYSNKDIRVAEETWGWVTKTEEGDAVSTWRKEYLVN